MKSKQIQAALSGPNSPFRMRVNTVCATNISWGLFSWGEADYVVVTKARFLVEIEIKVSPTDFKRDILKKKWKSGDREKMVRRFYYAVPLEMVDKIREFLPEDAGLITVEQTKSYGYRVKVVKESEVNRNAREMTDKEIYNLARLQCFRWFNTLNVKDT